LRGRTIPGIVKRVQYTLGFKIEAARLVEIVQSAGTVTAMPDVVKQAMYTDRKGELARSL
jgi:hypothetical protein